MSINSINSFITINSVFSINSVTSIKSFISIISINRMFLVKNQSTPRPSEHPPVMGAKMSKRLPGSGIKGCKYKTSYGIQTASPMQITLGQQYNVGEKPTVICFVPEG